MLKIDDSFNGFVVEDPIIYFNSQSESGNIFFILASVRKELKKQQRMTDFNILSEKIHNSHSYKEALDIVREYVNLIDLDGMV